MGAPNARDRPGAALRDAVLDGFTAFGHDGIARPNSARGSDQRRFGSAYLCATNSTMASVGIRELRQRASELLRRVEAGESIEITDRGRPVAVLAPLPAAPLERLRAAGDLQAGDGDLTDLPEPLAIPAGAEPPSAALARLRQDER